MARSFAGLGNFMDDLADTVKDGLTDKARAVALSIDQNVVISTPVDTGRARGNWLVGVDQEPTDAEQDTKSPDGSSAIARAEQEIDKFDSAKNERIFIANNLPYIGKLNDGSSAQAPANFVQKAATLGAKAGGRIIK